ncbi:OpgC family protein [Bartonella apis]|uniref:OpgC family protein n=1 Tax=Bartonella apis TaxID=1686310 RepID=UPI000968E6CA|nr:OpgC domain-containing protein [Bartonella apis]OLY46842.1 hypothetical protein PEB0150_006940 [Bartonella apis]OLY48840.1 hypothetical protein PEB0122_005950 [Bartonella apis]
MAQMTTSKRDTRIDVFRALALLTIFINHVPGTIFEWLTHKHFGFSDSAEAFVLISGISVALAYGSKFFGQNRLLISLKLLRRSVTLYSAHILTTLVSLAIFVSAATFFHRPEFLNVNNIPSLLKDPAQSLLGLVTLGHQLGYNNILSLYLVLILATPFILYLANKSLKLLIILSVAIYIIAGFYGIAPHNYPTKGVWFLNPLSWQLLFVIGFSVTLYVKRGGYLPRHPLFLVIAGAYLVISCLWVRLGWWWINPTMGLPSTLAGFNKTFLSLPRLFHILALAYLIVAIYPLNRIAKVDANHPLAILGKHSLAVFVTGTVLAMAGQVLKVVNPGGLSYDTLLLTTGIVIQFAVAYYFEWIKFATKRLEVVSSTPADVKAPGIAEPANLINANITGNDWQKA